MTDQPEAVLEALPLASLPALKRPLDGGIFCGVITLPDGKHYAIVKLDAKPKKRLNWKDATKWAKKVGGQLPSRAVAALLFSFAKELFEPSWHWTCESHGSSCAWGCPFDGGTQSCYVTSYDGFAVAVRLIPLTS